MAKNFMKLSASLSQVCLASFEGKLHDFNRRFPVGCDFNRRFQQPGGMQIDISEKIQKFKMDDGAQHSIAQVMVSGATEIPQKNNWWERFPSRTVSVAAGTGVSVFKKKGLWFPHDGMLESSKQYQFEKYTNDLAVYSPNTSFKHQHRRLNPLNFLQHYEGRTEYFAHTPQFVFEYQPRSNNYVVDLFNEILDELVIEDNWYYFWRAKNVPKEVLSVDGIWAVSTENEEGVRRLDWNKLATLYLQSRNDGNSCFAFLRKSRAGWWMRERVMRKLKEKYGEYSMSGFFFQERGRPGIKRSYFDDQKDMLLNWILKPAYNINGLSMPKLDQERDNLTEVLDNMWNDRTELNNIVLFETMGPNGLEMNFWITPFHFALGRLAEIRPEAKALHGKSPEVKHEMMAETFLVSYAVTKELGVSEWLEDKDLYEKFSVVKEFDDVLRGAMKDLMTKKNVSVTISKDARRGYTEAELIYFENDQ